MPHPPIGKLLREWRALRGISQFDLALKTDVSPRHLSYIETGKAQASRNVLHRLADVLVMPLRERNTLMMAAGYAPQYPETTWEAESLEMMRRAVDLIITHQEPYPAFVLNRCWDVLMVNDAAVRINQLIMHGRPSKHGNILRQVFDPEDVRAAIVNWEEVAEKFILLLHQEIAASPNDDKAQALLDEVLHFPGVPKRWRQRDINSTPSPILTMTFQTSMGHLSFFETITTFATPRNVTLDDIRIDCAFPADGHTAAVCAKLAEQASRKLG
ncbi:helix-turn-helix domain-containing protein [Dyella silvae]|uniref:helix-turn-helix domain-containing protein n=1 Tax=Dyella silvae TaxID=2994424 RepID=UPI002263EC55|nr:helix-turn-helix transcriptional regulator [Dyella silvae]